MWGPYQRFAGEKKAIDTTSYTEEKKKEAPLRRHVLWQNTLGGIAGVLETDYNENTEIEGKKRARKGVMIGRCKGDEY